MIENINKRKYDHIQICLNKNINSKKKSGFDDIMLIHKALSKIDIDNIKLSTKFLGKDFSYPFMIASITGGFKEANIINKNLAIAAEELNIGMGVGSQRIAIEKKKDESFSFIRKYAPTTFIYANIGISQINNYNIDTIEKIINMIDADALAIHFNILQELIQPEGNIILNNLFKNIKRITKEIKIPIFAKGVGCGFSRDDAIILKKLGVKAIDVGGVGGTSWSGIEYYRSKKINDYSKQRLGKIFWDFGIPTALSIIECKPYLPVIATGGIRSGLDIAKSIILGSSIASSALPFISLSKKSKDNVIEYVLQLMKELKTTMLLIDKDNIQSLSKTPFIITGFSKEYLNQRKIKI